MKPVKFKSVLICDPPEKGWHYISVEAKYAEKFEKKGGTRRVVPWMRAPATSIHHFSADARNTLRSSVNDSPANHRSRTYGT